MRQTAADTTDSPAQPGAPTVSLAGSAAELNLPLSDVVVFFACNELFAPYLSVALQSIIEHTSPTRRYDVVVLTGGLERATMETLHRQVAGCLASGDAIARTNVGIGFLDVAAALRAARIRLPRGGRFGVEASFRLMAPTLLEGVRKAIYLDCDLVVRRDLADLFDVELGDNLLGATRDADTAGIYAGYDTCVRPHIDRVVGLDDPYTYFQSGVLLFNLEQMRASCPLETMLGFARGRRLRWPDQDVLNHVARGRYVRLDTRWNFLTNWQRLRRPCIVAQAPQEIQDDYDAARLDPFIVHYAGPDGRPWLYPDCDMGELFWHYVRLCPFSDEIDRRLATSKRSVAGLLKRLQVAFIYKLGMPAFDAVFPPKTRRRHAVLTVYEGLGGRVA